MPLRIRNYEDLRSFATSKPELFAKLSDECESDINFLKLVYGFDFGLLLNNLPVTPEELAINFFSFYKVSALSADSAAVWLAEYFNRALIEEKRQEEQPELWKPSDFDLEQRIILEKMHKQGMIQDYQLGLTSKHHLLNILYKTQPIPEDFFYCHVINPREYKQMQVRFGEAVLLNSLPKNSARYRQLLANIQRVGLGLNQAANQNLTLAQLKEKMPEVYALARQLYKTVQSAKNHLNISQDFQKARQQAFELFVNDQEQQAIALLSSLGLNLRKDQIQYIFNDFRKQLGIFIGVESNTNTSEFERAIENELANKGIFFRRQVAYSEFSQTTKKYIADFVVGNTIIEVSDGWDEFLHNDEYFERLNEKQRLAQSSGKNFIVLTPDQVYQEQLRKIAEQAFIPEQVYNLGSFTYSDKYQRLNPGIIQIVKQARVDKTKIRFCDNVCMIGSLQRKAV